MFKSCFLETEGILSEGKQGHDMSLAVICIVEVRCNFLFEVPNNLIVAEVL